jgi:hypothetical protein
MRGCVPDLTITVDKAAAIPFAASPTIAFDLRVQNLDPSEIIHTAVLRCQFQIETTRRRYSATDQEQLGDLFGTPERWGQTLRSMLWTHASVVVPAFTGTATVRLPVACTFDFNLAVTKYFAGLTDGEIPLCLLFSGTVFYADPAGSIQAAPIPWEKEARFRLPAATWKEMMNLYYPNSAWLCLRKDVFEKLYQYKLRHGLPTWEGVIESILARSEADPPGASSDPVESAAAKLEGLRWRAMNRI